ncbi:hypothetical protein L211DRAFT_295753 [Terfezia boudieri ATCC MYA-4762]|uniref:Uncharacterized protein n=1 Tax=Terfezia boudieri ATCC MYA-4762 TaxID=1051890 RepID=A0A3N4LYF6_9PEZI|nr:hypothetical protein L211DRAFT_295753 [Terfezia boudieri ATCC MYA-4762]
MVKSLTEQKEVVKYLRLRFLSNFNEFIPVPLNEKCQADFLAALGILSPDAHGSKLKMTSPILDSLARQHVIPIVVPTPRSPRKGRVEDLDFLSVLREVLKAFNKELIVRASVGLAERYVQLITWALWLACIKYGPEGDIWGTFLMGAVMAINTRAIKVQGFTPSEILLDSMRNRWRLCKVVNRS